MAWISLANAAVTLGGRDVVREISADVGAGELVVIVGPNGAGKTTLLRAMGGLVAPRSGTIRAFGHDPARVDRRVLARELAYLPQQYDLAFPFVVEEVVLLGRYVHQRGLGLASDEDLAAARAAMTACDVADLAERRFDELSGGEARRVIIAQALCQGARCMLLDEPTSGLDPAHAHGVFKMLVAHCERGSSAVVVTHDLDLALRHATTMWLLSKGHLSSRGAPRDVMTSGATREAFGVGFHLGTLPSGEPFAVPA
jgi:ABC-type cobalamin/Fe3+-siderophores transport system ATPase subunit